MWTWWNYCLTYAPQPKPVCTNRWCSCAVKPLVTRRLHAYVPLGVAALGLVLQVLESNNKLIVHIYFEGDRRTYLN